MIPTERRTARRLRRLPLLVVLAAGLGAGTACAGSGAGSDNGVASIKTASDKKTDDSADTDGKSKKAPEDAALDFARCMREHGIDMPDPDTSGGAGIVKFSAGTSVAGTKLDGDMSKFQEANEACRDLLGDGGPQMMDPEQQQEMQDQALAFSRCMREHGVDMPDPNFSGQGTVTMKIGEGLDPGSDKFQSAQQACGSAFGPGGKGGPGSVTSVAPGGVIGGKGGDGAFSISGGTVASNNSGGGK